MIKILSQTNLDLTMFLGDSEPFHKIAGLNFALFKKGYFCEGTGSMSTSSITEDNQTHIGIRVRFTKSDRPSRSNNSFFKRMTNDNDDTVELKIAKGLRYNKKTEVNLCVKSSVLDRNRLFESNILSRYSRHVTTTREMVKLPEIKTSTDLKEEDFRPKTDEEIVASNIHLDTAVSRVKDFEEKYKYLYPLLVIRNFTGTNSTLSHDMSLAEFDKFSKQIEIIQEVSIPTNSARNKFIELCDIFKSNKVLNNWKANNFEFKKDHRDLLTIEFFGVEMVKESKFNHFKYFDHPGINFCADYLDKSRTFDIVEAKISKEIITRI